LRSVLKKKYAIVVFLFKFLSQNSSFPPKFPILQHAFTKMRPRRGRPTTGGRNDGGGNEEDDDEQKLSVFDREKVLEFLLRGPHGAGRGQDDDGDDSSSFLEDRDGFDGGAHGGGGGGGRDDVVVDDDNDSEKENDGEEKTKTTSTSRGRRSVLIKERERKKAERFYQVMLKEAQRLVCEGGGL